MNKLLKKLIIPALIVGASLTALTSCNGASSITFGKETSTNELIDPVNTTTNNTSNTGDNKGSLLNPSYVSTNYVLKELNLNDIEEKKSEDVVEDIVTACVSVTAESQTSISRGSGVLFTYDETLGFSYVITCFHVIESYHIFSVTLDDGTEYEASLVGGYSDEDIAVLAIKKLDLNYVDILNDSDNLKRGMDVLCIGNPLGTLPNSVSKGVISYVNRTIQQNTYTKRTLIQTDVAINSGNSGGGLFSANGLLIGIVSNKYSKADIDNLGFAIPSKTFLSTIKNILDTAKYDKANQEWQLGYIEGDFNLGFTVSLGQQSKGMWSYVNVIYISDVSTNPTDSGASTLKIYDIINSITIKYKDTTKENKIYTVASLSSSTTTEIMNFLMNNGLTIGDTLEFNITRNNEKMDVEFEIIQYKYSI